MSTDNINISRDNIVGKCDLKCSYNFKYSQSNSTAKNNGINVNLTYDNSSVPPVLYNNEKYNVSKVIIYKPSIHYFNGGKVDGEIAIEHIPIKGGSNLIVCIPIKSSTNSTDASIIINEIIDGVSSNAPAEGESTNLNISNFNLQNIVPVKPFYSYSDFKNNDYIIFGILDAIPLSLSKLNILGKIIKPFQISTQGSSLFYNSSGPNTTSIGEGIYISCNPTGASDEEVKVEYEKNTVSYNFSNILESPVMKIFFQILIGLILSIIVFTTISYIYSFLTIGVTKLPRLPNFKN